MRGTSVAATCIAALDLLLAEPQIIDRLWENTRFFKVGLQALGFNTGLSESPITPVIVGDGALAMTLSDRLFRAGVFAQGIAFPTVARDKARVRTIVTATHTKDQLQFAGRQPTWLRSSCTRGVRGIQHIDIDGDVNRPIPDPRANPVDGLIHSPTSDVHGVDDREAQSLVVHKILAVVQRPANSDMCGDIKIQHTLFHCPSERSAVGVRSPKVGVPGVQVRIEVHECDWAVHLRQCPQDRQGDRVVTAEGDHRTS